MDIAPYQLDVLKELINIGAGKAAGILNQMSRSHIDLSVPEMRIAEPDELFRYQSITGIDKLSAVSLAFDGAFSGSAALVFPPESAASLVSIIVGIGEIPFDLDSLRIGTLQELGNIVLNGVMGSITNLLKRHIQYYPPEYREDTLRNIILPEASLEQSMILLVRTHFNLENQLIEGDIVIVFRVGSFAAVLEAIDALFPPEQLGIMSKGT